MRHRPGQVQVQPDGFIVHGGRVVPLCPGGKRAIPKTRLPRLATGFDRYVFFGFRTTQIVRLLLTIFFSYYYHLFTQSARVTFRSHRNSPLSCPCPIDARYRTICPRTVDRVIGIIHVTKNAFLGFKY